MRATIRLLFVLVCLLWPAAGVAQSAEPTAKDRAKVHFAIGVEKFESSDYDGAVAAYNAAYELLPYAIIQFNIGLAREKQRNPIATIAAMERAVAGTPKLSEARRTRATNIIAKQQRLVATLVVECNITGADVRLDGRKAGAVPLAGVPVPAGRPVTIETHAEGFLPDSRVVSLLAGQAFTEKIVLVALEMPPAKLNVETVLPGVDVYVDGVRRAITPLNGPIGIAPDEPHRVELRRKGYRTHVETVKLAPGLDATLTFAGELDPSATARGRVVLDVTPEDATVRIDGQMRPERALDLVVGPHVVTIERTGYDTAKTTIVVPEGARVDLSLGLLATEETRQAKIADAQFDTGVAWGLTIGGVALLGGGVAALAYNATFAPDVERRADEDSRCRNSGTGEVCPDTQAVASDEQVVTALWIVGGASLAIGTGLAITGITLLATGEDADAFRLSTDSLEIAWTPTVDVRPGLVVTGVRGTF